MKAASARKVENIAGYSRPKLNRTLAEQLKLLGVKDDYRCSCGDTGDFI
jgi:hypothetical protein